MTCRHRDPFTRAALAELIERYNAGTSYVLLAAAFGLRSRECVYGILGGAQPDGCPGRCMSRIRTGRP